MGKNKENKNLLTTFLKSIFGYDLKLLSFLKTKHSIYKELAHFQKFIFIQKL
jgi:hypothetical protein